MKVFILALLLSACAMEPVTPCACQRNMQYCVASYENNFKSIVYTKEEWVALCQQDMNVCKRGYGQ